MENISVNNTHYTPLPYITWGLIWDLKTKRGDPNTDLKDHWTLIQDFKTKKGNPILAS